MQTPHSVHPLACWGQFGLFRALAIRNEAARNGPSYKILSEEVALLKHLDKTIPGVTGSEGPRSCSGPSGGLKDEGNCPLQAADGCQAPDRICS